MNRIRWRHLDGRPLTGKGVIVAMVDSGWDRTQHNSQILPGVGFVDPNDDLGTNQTDDDSDNVGHGTACTNLLLHVAPSAAILPVRVFGSRLETSPETIEMAIDWAIARGVHIINLSLGTFREDARNRLYAACARACAAGIVLVAAAGHEANGYPSAFDIALSVGIGPWDDPLIYLYSPGEAIECQSAGRNRRTIGLGGREVTVAGTSFAAPNISGIVALWLEQWPGLKLADVRQKLAEYSAIG